MISRILRRGHIYAVLLIQKKVMSRNGASSSRTGDFWRELCPGETAASLARSYGERAGEEVLFRALLAERDMDDGGARFWLGVYTELRRDGQE